MFDKVSLPVQGKSSMGKFISIVSFVVLHEERTFRSCYCQICSICSDTGASQSTSQFKTLMQAGPKFLQFCLLGAEDVPDQTAKLITFQDREEETIIPLKVLNARGYEKRKFEEAAV